MGDMFWWISKSARKHTPVLKVNGRRFWVQRREDGKIVLTRVIEEERGRRRSRGPG